MANIDDTIIILKCFDKEQACDSAGCQTVVFDEFWPVRGFHKTDSERWYVEE